MNHGNQRVFQLEIIISSKMADTEGIQTNIKILLYDQDSIICNETTSIGFKF